MADEFWTLTFRVLPDGPAGAIRVRRLLKTALRRDRLRCLLVVEHDEERVAQIEACLRHKESERSG